MQKNKRTVRKENRKKVVSYIFYKKSLFLFR